MVMMSSLILLSVFLVLEEQIVEFLSVVSEISSEVEITHVESLEFGWTTRKLLFFLLIII